MMAGPNFITLVGLLVAKSQIKNAIRRMVWRIILICFALFCFFMALFSGLLGLWFVMAPKFGPVISSLALSGGFLFLGLVLVVVAQRRKIARRKVVLDMPDVPLAALARANVPYSTNALLLGAIVLGLLAGIAGK